MSELPLYFSGVLARIAEACLDLRTAQTLEPLASVEVGAIGCSLEDQQVTSLVNVPGRVAARGQCLQPSGECSKPSTGHLLLPGTGHKRCPEPDTFFMYRGTSLMRSRPTPRSTAGPYAKAYCRVLGECVVS